MGGSFVRRQVCREAVNSVEGEGDRRRHAMEARTHGGGGDTNGGVDGDVSGRLAGRGRASRFRCEGGGDELEDAVMLSRPVRQPWRWVVERVFHGGGIGAGFSGKHV
eukprot:2175737-Prymnesium_polylepis.3